MRFHVDLPTPRWSRLRRVDYNFNTSPLSLALANSEHDVSDTNGDNGVQTKIDPAQVRVHDESNVLFSKARYIIRCTHLSQNRTDQISTPLVMIKA